jgi:hypothetical protein
MKRRSTATQGCVNFPIGNLRYESTNEGGMVVKLVVTDDSEDFENTFQVCCGAYVYDMLTECLVGDDQRPVTKHPEDPILENNTYAEWLQYHYPNTINHDPEYFSRPYLCSIVLASTGWSGWDIDKAEYFYCTIDHLTQEGIDLYNHLYKLYKCDGVTRRIHLLTFLDT